MNLNVLQSEYDSLCMSVSHAIRDYFYKDYRHGKSNKENTVAPTFCIFGSFSRGVYRLTSAGSKYNPSLRKYTRITPIKLGSIEYATKTLPSYGKALEAYLESGEFKIGDRVLTQDELWGCPYPDILQLAMGIDTLAEHDFVPFPIEPRTQAFFIRVYRQLTLYFYKVEIPFSKEVELNKQYDFITNDQQKAVGYFKNGKFLAKEIKSIISDILQPLSNIGGNKFSSWSVNEDGLLVYNTISFFNPVNKAGYSGGAVSNAKSYIRQRAKRYADVPQEISYVSKFFDFQFQRKTGLVHPSKLEFVPKDGRGPRMIAEEPDYMGLVQSYFQVMFYERLLDFGIDLTNQDNNRYKALSSSGDKAYATIDMKNASDNIMLEHIQELFPRDWAEILELLRSPIVELKDGQKYKLNCFATMGNKLTFPVQSIIFYAIAKAAALKSRASGEVLVYGDDIVVPTRCVKRVIATLESWGFDVNKSKTFYKGNFRESCGIFAFKGYDVSCVYRRKIELTAEHINELLQANLYIESNLPKGYNIEGFVNLGMDIKTLEGLNVRWNNALNRIEIKVRVHRPFVLKDDMTYDDDAPLYDEWLRTHSTLDRIPVIDVGKQSSIFLPRIVDYVTRKDIIKDTWIPLDISHVPATINEYTIKKVIWTDYSYLDSIPMEEGLHAPIIFGDINIIDLKIEGDNMWNKHTKTFNTNFDMFGAFGALNKKVDTILSAMRDKAQKAQEQLEEIDKALEKPKATSKRKTTQIKGRKITKKPNKKATGGNNANK